MSSERPSDSEPLVRRFELDEAMVLDWAALSGDYNRLHVDQEFAARTAYGRCIAHGPILATLLAEWMATVAGSSAWGTSGSISFRFRAPVFYPAAISASMSLARAGGQTHARIECVNGEGERVMSAEASWANPAE